MASSDLAVLPSLALAPDEALPRSRPASTRQSSITLLQRRSDGLGGEDDSDEDDKKDVLDVCKVEEDVEASGGGAGGPPVPSFPDGGVRGYLVVAGGTRKHLFEYHGRGLGLVLTLICASSCALQVRGEGKIQRGVRGADTFLSCSTFGMSNAYGAFQAQYETVSGVWPAKTTFSPLRVGLLAGVAASRSAERHFVDRLRASWYTNSSRPSHCDLTHLFRGLGILFVCGLPSGRLFDDGL